MLKLIKYLKPFAWSIALVFALLFVQALADLSLPDYMSRIVNVGIQQSGIDSAVPQAVGASEWNKLLLFMNGNEQSEVAQDYKLLDKQNLSATDYAKYLKTYPQLASAQIYILTNTSKGEKAKLDAIFSKAIAIVSAIETNGLSVYAGGTINLPPGTDPFALLASLPQAQLDTIRSTADAQVSAVPASLIAQYAVAYLSSEYKSLGMDVGRIQTGYLLNIALLMLVITLLSGACSVGVGFLAARVAAGFARNTRQQVFKKVEDFSGVEFDRFSTASLITRTTNDVQQIQLLLVILLRIVFYAPLIGIGAIIRALGENVSMSWIIAAAVMALLAMIGTVFAVAVPKFRLMQKLIDRLNSVTREILSGTMVIRAFNTQRLEEKKFDGVNVDLTKTGLFVNRVMVLMMPVMMLYERHHGPHRLGRLPPGCRRHHADWQHDGLHAVRHHGHLRLPDGVHGFHHAAAGHCFRTAHRRGAGDPAGDT